MDSIGPVTQQMLLINRGSNKVNTNKHKYRHLRAAPAQETVHLTTRCFYYVSLTTYNRPFERLLESQPLAINNKPEWQLCSVAKANALRIEKSGVFSWSVVDKYIKLSVSVNLLCSVHRMKSNIYCPQITRRYNTEAIWSHPLTVGYRFFFFPKTQFLLKRFHASVILS